MNQKQNKVLPVAVIIAILVGVAIGAVGYYALMFHSAGSSVSTVNNQNSQNENNGGNNATIASTSIGANSNTSSVFASSSAESSASAPVAVDMSTWKTYSNYELGFSMEYPADVSVDDVTDPAVVTFAFPDSYFSTAMKDSDSVSISANATCTPISSFDDKNGSEPSQNILMSGTDFTKNIQSSAAAGSYDSLIAYDTDQNNVCYRISIASHGPNDAGALDAAHAADAANVANIASAMVSTFTFVNTPAGENEADYSAAQGGVNPTEQSTQSQSVQTSSPAAPGAIAITTISPIPVSVGGQLTVTGSGFSGHDTIVQISNGSVTGVLWGGMPVSDTLLTLPVPAQVCTQYIGASGAACPSYLAVSPGVYTLTVTNQNGTTNPLYIRVQ